MGLFSGISSASKTGGRLPFIERPGVILAEVNRYGSGTNRNGLPFAKCDITVLYTISPIVTAAITQWNEDNPGKAMKLEPHQPGERLTVYTAVKQGQMRETHLGEIRAFTESIVESLSDGDVAELMDGFGISYSAEDGFDDEGLEKVIAGLSEGDGTDCDGALLLITSDPRINRAQTGTYTASGFVSGNDVARELIAAGQLENDLIAGFDADGGDDEE